MGGSSTMRDSIASVQNLAYPTILPPQLICSLIGKLNCATIKRKDNLMNV